MMWRGQMLAIHVLAFNLLRSGSISLLVASSTHWRSQRLMLALAEVLPDSTSTILDRIHPCFLVDAYMLPC